MKPSIQYQATCNVGPYKGYVGRAEYDDDDGEFTGTVLGTRDVITFVGKTVDELGTAFVESVDDYLALCKSRGEKPEKPYSGKFVVRVAPELHARLSTLAESSDRSLNSVVVDLLEATLNSSERNAPASEVPAGRKKSSPRKARGRAKR